MPLLRSRSITLTIGFIVVLVQALALGGLGAYILARLFADADDAPQIQEYSFDQPAGRRWLKGRSSAIRGRGGAVEAVVWVARDVTLRKAIEENLRQAGQILDSLGILSARARMRRGAGSSSSRTWGSRPRRRRTRWRSWWRTPAGASRRRSRSGSSNSSTRPTRTRRTSPAARAWA